MSRIGSREINFNSGIQCSFDEGSSIINIEYAGKVYNHVLPDVLSCVVCDSSLTLLMKGKANNEKRLLGLHRSLLNNLITGLQSEFMSSLSLVGVGYKADINGKYLGLYVGYTHSIKYVIPDDVTASCIKGTKIILKSYNKQLLGIVVSELCNLRKYDPYKGKGVILDGICMLRKESGKKK